jgi:hypothetical protein
MTQSMRPQTARVRFRWAGFALVVLALSWACGPPRERFRHTFESPEALTAEFLRALEAGDRARLKDLPLSEQEYCLEIFPEMPVYGNIPPDLAWSQMEGANLYGVGVALDRHRGRSFELEKITFEGTTSYQTFVVHRESTLHLRDRETGKREELPLFGSVVEHDGGYTLLSVNIDR